MTGPFQFTRFPGRLAAALRGVRHLLRTSANARIHLLATIVVASLGLWLKLSRNDWSWIIAAVGLVWCVEGLNSAIGLLVVVPRLLAL